MEYSSKPAKNEGDPLKRRQTLQLKFVDRFPFEQRTSRMDKNGVSWSYCRLVSTCFPLSSFCFLSCFHAFPVTVSVGFLSAFVSFCWSRLFFPILFFLLLHLHFVKFLLSACKYSFHPAVLFSRLVLRSGTKPKRRHVMAKLYGSAFFAHGMTWVHSIEYCNHTEHPKHILKYLEIFQSLWQLTP